jgi:CheY-like chemotaxis protein
MANTECNVFVIEPNVTWRQNYQSVFKQAGFKDADAFSSFQEFNVHKQDVLGNDDFLLAPLSSSSFPEMLKMLRSAGNSPKEVNPRFITLYQEGDIEKIPELFELGLIVAIKIPTTPKIMIETISEARVALLEGRCPEPVFVASQLFDVLKSMNRVGESVSFLESLTQKFPREPKAWHLYISSLLEAGQRSDARKAAGRSVAFLGIDQSIKSLLTGYGIEFNLTDNPSLSSFNITKVLVVDGDDQLVNLLCEKLKCPDVEVVGMSTAQECIEKIEKGFIPDLVVFDWRLPLMPGLKLLQRFLASGLEGAHFVVLSGFFQAGDAAILTELGVHEILQKPLPLSEIVEGIFESLLKALKPETEHENVKSFRTLVAKGEFAEAEKLLNHFRAKGSVSAGNMEFLAGTLALKKGKNSDAANHFAKALPLLKDKVSCLHSLGMALYKLQDFKTASRMFQKADEMSAFNVERLCQICECQLAMGENSNAETTLAKVKKLDSGNPNVQSTEALVSIATTGTTSQEQNANILKQRGMIATFNNKAIVMSRGRNPAEAEKILRGVLNVVPKSHPEYPVVVYNLGVVLARQEKWDDSRKAMDLIQKWPKKLATKVAQLQSAVTNMSSGKRSTKSPTASENENDMDGSYEDHIQGIDERLSSKALTPRGLRGIYFSPSSARPGLGDRDSA